MESDWKWDRLDSLERKVAEFLLQGKSNAAICAKVFHSRARVQECIKRILIKTGTDSTRAAIVLLVEERETLSLIRVLEQASDGVAIIQDRVVKFANRALLRMYGYNGEEMVGIPLIQVVASEYRNFVMEQHELRLNGEPFVQSYAIRIPHKSGQEKDIVVSSAGMLRYRGRRAVLAIITPHI